MSSSSEESDDDVPISSYRRGKDSTFWRTDRFVPQVYPFDPNKSGFNIDIEDNARELDYFKIFIDSELINLVVEKTNSHHRNQNQNKQTKDSSRDLKWTDTNLNEMYVLIAMCLMMSRNSQSLTNECWSTDPLFYTPIYTETIPRNRYQLLTRMLSFTDDEEFISETNMVEKIVSIFQKKFSRIFYPYQSLCIENTHHLFKGGSSLDRHMANKVHSHGTKLYALCDCKTGYLINFVLHTLIRRKKIRINKMSEEIVLPLITPYLERGHNLYLNSSYSNPTLFNLLHSYKTNICGIAKADKLNLPTLSNTNAYHFDSVMAQTWNYKRKITILSTFHTNEVKNSDIINQSSNELIDLPCSIIDYQKNMDSLHRDEMQISSLCSIRKNFLFYKKIFFHLIDLSLFNAFVIFREKTGSDMTLSNFQISVINQMLQTHRPSNSIRKRRHIVVASTLKERHFLGLILSSTGNIQRRSCKGCNRDKRSKDTKYICKQCNIALCAVPCFERYHIEKLKHLSSIENTVI